MTNGEKLKEVFPSIELYEKSHDAIQINFDSVWWNAEYKEPTTKNDLEVECIDRQATLDAIIKRLGIKNESYLLPAEKTIYQQIKDMPLVTPISKECIDCIAEDKTFLKMDRVKQLLNSDELDDWEVLKKIREVVEE